MRGDFWVTKSGVVVMQVAAEDVATMRAKCLRVRTGGIHGYLRIDRMRPATRREVERAQGGRRP